ncbi:YHYH protein [Sneathiella sp. P13V-1]|uniref:YHYH protein n=1 Tax=Sneathiella sp. P13V-1 TaxID=2697366 RepID=UPI00187B2815|nr:YHYH protein [Sneathiella sp. P13V-1]MBE7637474.1 YHYH protein [Sneathiella sp. P13V-1]
MKKHIIACIFGMAVMAPQISEAQAPPTRYHRATEAGDIQLREAEIDPITASKVTVTVKGDRRVISANGISKHKTGRFPGEGNPNHISEQNLEFSLPLKPKKSTAPRFYTLGVFGIGVNGVLFDPQAAEWYHGDRNSKWQYDPLGSALPLGFDAHHAHVQPNGTYHYHGLPTGLLKNIGFSSGKHSPLVGWAMDGFPIYALFGQKNGQIKKVKPSYSLKNGNRLSGGNNPGGKYDGAFVADWEFVEGHGDLDACNGTMTISKEFPNGTYAYFLTETFPVVPRCFMGTPVALGPQGRGRDRQGPGGGRPDLNAAADKLGIHVNDLRRALGPPPPDFRDAARQLGISEEKLRRALHPR